MVEQDGNQLTEDEARIYDRQIRLWGLESQKRLRAAKILIIGMGGLGAEAAKNIILSGVKSVTLLDHNKATEADRFSQFFIPHDRMGENRATSSVERAQLLNPLVEVTADTSNVSELPDDYFSSSRWNLIIATGLPLKQYIRIDDICRKNRIFFFAGDVFGLFGYMFADPNKHRYLDEVVTYLKKGQKSVKTVKVVAQFPSLKDTLSVDFTKDQHKGKLRRMETSYFVFNFLMKFRTNHGRDPMPTESDIAELLEMRNKECFDLSLPNERILDELIRMTVGAPLGPACAIVGAVLAQEVVKVVTSKSAPHKNMFFFDPVKNLGHVQDICPQEVEVADKTEV